MTCKLTYRVIFPILLIGMQACTHSTSIEKSELAERISNHSGLSVPRLESTNEFWIPPGTNIEDGLSERDSALIALANNRAFQVDMSDLGLARADLIEARELPNPVLNVLLPVDGNLNEFSIAQMLSFLWQRPQRINNADLNVEMIAERLIQDGLGVIMNTSIAHAETIHAEKIAKLESEQAGILAEIADIVEAKFRLGETSQVEASIVRNDAMILKDSAINAEYEAETASFRLKSLMGFDDLRQQINVIPDVNTCSPALDDTQVIEMAFESRPDLEAARININRAGEALGLEKANIFNLIANLDLNEQTGGGYQFAPRLEIEIPVFSQNQGGLARARGEMEQAMYQFLAKKQEISLQVNDALAQLVSACERVIYWQESIYPLLKTQETRISKAYDAGETAFLSVLDIKQKLVVAEKSLANAVLNQKKAVAKLNFSVAQKVIGTGQ